MKKNKKMKNQIKKVDETMEFITNQYYDKSTKNYYCKNEIYGTYISQYMPCSFKSISKSEVKIHKDNEKHWKKINTMSFSFHLQKYCPHNNKNFEECPKCSNKIETFFKTNNFKVINFHNEKINGHENWKEKIQKLDVLNEKIEYFENMKKELEDQRNKIFDSLIENQRNKNEI